MAPTIGRTAFDTNPSTVIATGLVDVGRCFFSHPFGTPTLPYTRLECGGLFVERQKKGILNALQVAAGPAGGALVAMVMFVMLRKGSDRIRHTRRRVLCGALRAGITAEFF